MIVAMKHLDLVCLASAKEETLTELRELGAIHLDLTSAVGAPVTAAKGAVTALETAVRDIHKARKELGLSAAPAETIERTTPEVLALAKSRADHTNEAEKLARQIQVYAPYGDFDPALAQKLLDEGIDLTSVVQLPEKLPPKRLSALQADHAALLKAVADETASLAATDDAALLKQCPALADKIAFEEARELMGVQGELACVSGWIPAPSCEKLRSKASQQGWGILLRDAAADETPPTLIEPPRFFKSMKALFAGLGIVPAYTETDVSVPFMCYFSLFFAMLVGDGAYGSIFLAATLWGWKKTAGNRSPLARSWLILLTVFSLATIAWGTLSDTWFGAQIPWCRDWVTVQWLGDVTYRHMMFLCFTIGASHLMLARIWNGVCKINDSTCIAEFGWAGILLFMYFVTNSIVGVFASIPTVMFVVFALSLIAVFGFTLKPSELKSRGAELGLLPLSIMSALGDIISYVRLFAVGLASVKVAENFNAMATGLFADPHAWWVTALMGLGAALILVIGHGLNLAMAGLSILVHAVRLNTLEFSNHKGVTWSGYAFAPFRRQATKV